MVGQGQCTVEQMPVHAVHGDCASAWSLPRELHVLIVMTHARGAHTDVFKDNGDGRGNCVWELAMGMAPGFAWCARRRGHGQTRPHQAMPDEAGPRRTMANQLTPEATRPDQTSPGQTRPDEARPGQT